MLEDPLAIANGWAAGISAYGVVLLTGLLGRFDVATTPAALQRTDVLVAAGVLTAIEFVADKVPVVDSLWDSVHTIIRPFIAVVLGSLIAGDADTLGQATVGALAGGVALGSHLTKATLRLAVNTSPEPFTNIGISTGEDVTGVGVVLLAWQHPWAAATLALVLLVAGIVLVVVVFGRVRRGWRWLGQRLEAVGLGPVPRRRPPPG